MNEEQRTDFIRRLREERDDATKRAFAQLLEDAQQLKVQVGDLKRVIIGHHEYGQWGLVQRVDNHGKRIKVLERLGAFILAIGALLALFWDEIKSRMLQ